MWNFIKGLFKFVFSLVAITTVVVGVGVVAFAYIFKKTLKISKEKLKKSFQISKIIINLKIKLMKASLMKSSSVAFLFALKEIK